MKKILYSLLIFASIFFVANKVNAANYTFPVMDNFLNYQAEIYGETYDLSNDFDKILSIAEGKNYNVVITVFHHHSTDDGYSCNSKYDGKCSYIDYYYVYVIKNNYVPTFKFDDSWIYSSINSNIVGLQVNVDSNYTATYNSLINALNNSDFSTFQNNFNVSTGSGKQWYYIPSTVTKPMIYGASADYTISFSSNTYYFGEHQITSGSLIPAYKNYFEIEEPYVAKRSVEFDKQVHNFDIYVDKSDKLADLTYKLNYIDYNDYTNSDMTKAKLYGVMFYGLKNENGLYHWEQLDDCTNWDFPSEYCHVKSKYDQLESELGKDGYTVEGYVDFLSIFDEYDTVRIVVRLDNAFAGKIDYWDKNLEISALDVDINYFGFDYARNLNDSDLNRYVIFSTKEQEITDNMFIVSSSDEIFIDYFDTKEGSFREYTAMEPRKNYDNTYIFTYDKIGLNNNLGFYVLTDKNRTERLVYNFYIKPHLYFSYNNSDVLEDTIYIDNTGNITNNNIAITPDELVDYEYNDINDLFENIKKFNDSINVISNEIHGVIQYAYDSLNIYIKSFLISIFTIVLVSATIILIRR